MDPATETASGEHDADASATLPFAALRVLDVSRGIAGAYATRLLADQGADVLRLEDPRDPDPLRTRTASGVQLPEGEDAALFRFLNAGKRSAFSADHAPSALSELLEACDVLVESGSIERVRSLVGDIDALRARSPQLCTVSISPWGRSGPYAERPASEWTLQAETGFMARRGRPETGHIGAGGMLGEYAAGSFAAVAAAAAWTLARATGRGRAVDVSMFEAMLICGTQYWDLNAQFCGGTLSQFHDIPAIEPARDGWVGFAPTTGEQWKSFCLMIDQPELAADEQTLTADARQARFGFFRETIHAWTRARTVDEILDQCEQFRIPSAPVGNGQCLLETDHFRERGVFVDNPHGFTQPRVPYRMSAFRERPVRRAPAPGQDVLAWKPHRPERPEPGAGAFRGLRVVDLTAFWAGPFATHVMAALGADVVKVESPSRPDGMRFVNGKPGVPIWEGGPIFHGANTGKRGIGLNLSADAGRAVLRRLIEDADLLVENFSARVLPNLGLDPETLLEWNPRLIVVRMPAWGLDGPWVHRTGFAMNVEQASGIAWRAGYADQPLTANYCDPIGGLHAVLAVLAALEHRARTGRGQQIEVPLVEPALNIAAEQVVEFSAYGKLLAPEGNRGPDHAPQGIYPCADGAFIAISIGSRDAWAALREVVTKRAGGAAPALFLDATLDAMDARRWRHDEIDAAIAAVTGDANAEAIADELTTAGVPAQPLVNGYDVMPHPQLESRRFYRELTHPVTGRSRYPGLPIVGLGNADPARPPPTLGQHNDEVLRGEQGLSATQLTELEAQGIVAAKPAWE